MKITIDIEELQNYKQQLVHWYSRRFVHFVNSFGAERFSEKENLEIQRALEQFDKENPKPKLFPNI